MDKPDNFNYNFLFKSVKAQDEKKTGRIIEGIASVEEIDRDDEVIMMSAIKNSVVDFMKNPVIRYGHTTPVGKALDARVEDNKFYIKAYITDKTTVGKEVCALIDEGIIKSYSVAGKVLDKNTKFDKELKKDITYINKLELYEVSVCDLPANRNSFFTAVAKSLDINKDRMREEISQSLFNKPYSELSDEQKDKVHQEALKRRGGKPGEGRQPHDKSIEKVKDNRPPKEWFDRCVARVKESGSAKDPEAVCAALWHKKRGKEEYPDLEKEIDSLLEKKVVKRGNKWCVIHCHGPKAGQSIKCFSSKEKALAMHRAIQSNKSTYREETPEQNLGLMKNMKDESKNKKMRDMEKEEKVEEPKETQEEQEETKPEEKSVDVDALVAKKVEEAMKKFKESQPVRKALVEETTEKVVDDSTISKFVVTGMSEPAGPTSEAVQKLHPFGHNETYMEANILGKDVSVSDKREGFTFKEAYTEKYTYTQTGGAGTAGYALIPVYVDPDIIDRTRRELPMVELISRKAVKGLTYDYNAITALTNAVNLAEDASLADLTDTYDRYSISMKYTYSTGRVTGPAIAGMKGYIDAVANEVKQRTLGLKRREDELIFSGDNTTNSEEFDGFDNLISTNNTALGGALTIAAMRTEIDQCHDAGGVVNLICTTKSVETDLKGLLMDYQRYVDTTQLSWGITKISFDGIPVIVDRYATSGYMYFLDTSVIFMAVLQDATYEELAKTNDSNKFTIKMYSALVCRAEAFCSILTGIS